MNKETSISTIIDFAAHGKHGYKKRLERIFSTHSIESVGDLIRIGRLNFRNFDEVGPGTLSRTDEALEELFNIISW